MSLSLLRNVFGKSDPVGQVVTRFDFSKLNVKEQTTPDFFLCNLAPSYGSLSKDNIDTLDGDVKIMTMGALRSLAAIPEQERSFEQAVATLKQNSLLEPQGNVESSRVDRLVKNGEAINSFASGVSPDAGIVKEVQQWLSGLVDDEDLLRSTQIDVSLIVNIIAQTGATVDIVEKPLSKPASYEKRLVDIGIFQFPDAARHYIQLYRIKITAWYESKRTLTFLEEKAGITGEFYSYKFCPHKPVIENLSLETKKKVEQQARELFT